MANDDGEGAELVRNQGRIEVLKTILDGEEMEAEYAKYRRNQQ